MQKQILIFFFLNLTFLCTNSTNAQEVQVEIAKDIQILGQVITKDTAHHNVIIGDKAGLNLSPMMISAVDGTLNTYIGYKAGQMDISGSSNVYMGALSGSFSSGSIQNNTFVGYKSGESNSGTENTFIGADVGLVNTEDRNVFVGYRTGNKNTSGTRNTFLGHSAGRDNSEAAHNTFLGYEAGCENTLGDENTMIGSGAGYFNSIGKQNTFLGRYSGEQNISGDQNTFIGTYTAKDNLRGDNNTFIGYNTYGSDVDSSYNQIVIGHSAIGKGHNMAVIGNADITDIYMNQNGSGVIHANATIVSSDRRLKRNITQIENVLDKVLNLNPVEFEYKSTPGSKEIGFVAQEVNELFPQLIYTKSDSKLGMKYVQLTAILTSALQEQHEKIETLESKLEEYEYILQKFAKELNITIDKNNLVKNNE